MDATLAVSPIDELRGKYADDLVDAGLLIRSGVNGIYGRSGAFEAITDGLMRMVARCSAADDAEVVRFPPVVTRENFIRSGHLTSFPTLSGSVHAFDGGDL